MSRYYKKGFTLIEGLAALFVFSLLIVTFYNVFIQTTTHMADGKQRRAAVSLANERMEHYRNLAYAEVGTTTNAPFGSIVADENITVNEMAFRIITSVFLIDDPLDGKRSNGTDMIPNDYKRVSVSIIWDVCTNASYARGVAEYGGTCSSKRVRLVSQFVPPGGLETIESGGVLSINVLDAEANAIPNAILTVHDRVRNQTFAAETDSTGNYMYIGAPACEGCYEIAVEKNGYEKITTKASPAHQTMLVGDVSYFPRFLHQSVTNGSMTAMSMIIKKQANLTLKTEDPFGNAIPNIDLAIQGGRVMGTNLNDNPLYTPQDVYGFSKKVSTNSSGSVTVRTDTTDDGAITTADHTNPGIFNFTLDETENGFTFWKMSPGIESNAQQVSVNADVTMDAKMILVDNAYKSVLVHVINGDGVPIANANVYLHDNQETPTYDVMQKTDVYGYAYFPSRSESEPFDIVPLLDGEVEYEYIVSAGGYVIKNDVVTIEDEKLKKIEVILTAI